MNGQRNNLEPILCAHLLRKVDDKLIDLLRLLEPREWDLQTIAPLWKVRDVAAHLLIFTSLSTRSLEPHSMSAGQAKRLR